MKAITHGQQVQELDAIRYMIYLASKRGQFNHIEVSTGCETDYINGTISVRITIPRFIYDDPEADSGLRALAAGVPIDDLLA